LRAEYKWSGIGTLHAGSLTRARTPSRWPRLLLIHFADMQRMPEASMLRNAHFREELPEERYSSRFSRFF
jgi:hypothetical protein